MAHRFGSRHRFVEVVFSLTALLALALPAAAVCPPSCPATGGGPPEADCHAEFASPALRLNFPPFDPATPQPARELYCFDGDAGCDAPEAVDGVCVFDIDVCLHNLDPNLPSCTPSDVVAVDVEGAPADPDLAALQTALNALLPATSNACTEGQQLHVPVVGAHTGAAARGHKAVHLTVHTQGGGTAEDRLELSCVPRDWPSHGFNHSNHRSNPNEAALSPAVADRIQIEWQVELGSTATSTPILGNGLVYSNNWGGKVTALNADTGQVVWTYETGRAFIGSSGLTADGRLLATGGTVVSCLDALTGRALWTHDIGVDRADVVWASPEIANGRVFIGVASASDNPCVQGRLVALDLDTGAELWTLKTIPDRICDNDTSIACTTDDECSGGTCVAGRGGGVTASVAIDRSGEIVYMNTVGCYTFPSIGDSDSIFKIEAATGRILWKTRVQQPEQFTYCPMDGGKDCRSAADCARGACIKKNAYHDFGFLNGPLLVDADTGGGEMRPLVVSGSKDGTLYALDPEDGSRVWTNVVQPTPVSPNFAGFGLFNGAVGFLDQRFYATQDGSLFRPVPTDHLIAFDAKDGATVWKQPFDFSWGSVGLANGLIFAGSGTLFPDPRCTDDQTISCNDDGECPTGTCVDYGPFYIHDASNGERLREFLLPANVASGASIVDGNVYVGYGIFGALGGVVKFGLPSCLGDCNNNRKVEIDELVRGVNIGLGSAAMDECPRFDGNKSGDLTVDELVGGVGNSIVGCD